MSQNQRVFWDSLRSAVAADPSAPVVTWLGMEGRVELSGRTWQAAVVKAANLLGSELDVSQGSRVMVDVGNHWQSCVWSAAVLVCGGTLVDNAVDVSVVAVGSSGPGQVAVVSLDPFGMPPRDVPAGVLNASAEVRAMPDQLAVIATDGALAVDSADGALSLVELVAQAASLPPGPIALHGRGSTRERALWHGAAPSSGTHIVLGDAQTEQSAVQERIAVHVPLVG